MKKLALVSLFCLSLNAFAASDYDYFAQYKLSKEVSDDGDGEITTTYRFLMSDVRATIEIDATHAIKPSLGLFLLENDEYLVNYNEMVGTRADASSPWQWGLNPALGICGVEVKGRWSVPEQELLVGSFLVGRRGSSGGNNAVDVTLTKALASSEMVGQTLTLDYGYSNMGTDYPRMPWCPPVREDLGL